MKTSPTTRAAALVAAAALTFGLTSQAATAAEPNPAEPKPTGTTRAVDVQSSERVAAEAKPGKSIKSLKRALAKARKAEKKARQVAAAHTTALQQAQTSGASAVAAYRAAFTVADEARGKHRPAKAALDRARYLVDNEEAIYIDLDKRYNAIMAAYLPLDQARKDAQKVVDGIWASIRDLQAQQSAASTSQNEAATVAGNLMAYDIPQTQDQWNAAWTAEQNAWNAKEAARLDFANRKAQWDDTRKVNGYWQGLRNSTWRFVPGLDDAEALLNERQVQYNHAKDHRQNVEGYLNQLNAQLAEAQAAITHYANLVAGLGTQIQAARDRLPAAEAARDAAKAKADEAYKPFEALWVEAEAIMKEIEAAKKNLPGLIAAEKPLADAVTQAAAALDAVAPAYQSAQGDIDTASTNLATANAKHAEAAKKVKAAKKALKKAIKRSKKKHR